MADSLGTEHRSIMEPSGTTAKKKKTAPDWERFGLSREHQEKETIAASQNTESCSDGYQQSDNKNELFREDQNLSRKPWWKANFFIREPVLFGTWDGVFTSCVVNLISVIIFLRMGWIVGNAGIGLTILTIVMSVFVVLVVALSGIGVCERCRMEGGGAYFLISHVLGARIGGSVGIIYCFAQAVSCSLSVMGFGESVMVLVHHENQWIAKGVAVALVLLLLGINVMGVKWVIRLQLLLLMVLFLSIMDFLVGSFVHTVPDAGVTGYKVINIWNNSSPDYLPGESFFSIFGLFFSTVTGILAGINMSGDLKNPFVNIPTGTLSALGFSTFLYVSFALVLGATCVRHSLQTDYMIAEKVSIIGVLWLAGLYISSVSSCMGSLYGPPRILQTIASENVVPVIRILGRGRGPNKVPVYALVLITLVSLIFVFVGDVNTLASITTTAFMMCYCAVNYSYFALAMSYDKRQELELRFGPKIQERKKSTEMSNGVAGYSSATTTYPYRNKDSFEKVAVDLDKLFPERLTHRGQHHLIQQTDQSASSPLSPEADFDATKHSRSTESVSEQSDSSYLLGQGESKSSPNTEITKQPRSWYSFLCNRWLSLLGAVLCIVIMFGTQWAYALGEMLVALVIYIYIGRANPGYFPGIAEFNFYEWIKFGIQRCCRGHNSSEQIVVAASTPAVSTLASQLTEDNVDFANRERYHQSEVVQGENFDDYNSE
ncbi:hypothetical protein ACJMK2_001981 [Sinanodonta woodiana]|uniref:Solute carrier family 12 member 8 n=1 Tax=Sinanodonta woodiana TaxID=1069815 RepID=A0ABD3XVJ4_SINWO